MSDKPTRHSDILEEKPQEDLRASSLGTGSKPKVLIGRAHGVAVRPVQRAIRNGQVTVKRIDPEDNETPDNGRIYVISASDLPAEALIPEYEGFLRGRFELSEEVLAKSAEGQETARKEADPNLKRVRRRQGRA